MAVKYRGKTGVRWVGDVCVWWVGVCVCVVGVCGVCVCVMGRKIAKYYITKMRLGQ